VPAWPTLALGALPIAALGSDAQRGRWLPRVARGECVLSAALAESDCDDPFDPGTTARRDGAVWRLDGHKTTVPAGPLAERILVPARTPEGAIGLFLVEPAGPGARLEPQETSSRQPHGALQLDGARVAESDRVGDLARGAEQLRWLFERAVASLCAVQLGVSERQLEMTAEYTRQREQFDRPIGSFQAVHQRAADAYIMVEAIRLSLWEAAWRLAQDLDASGHVAVAKYWAAEAGQFVAYGCTHLHGGVGIDVDYPLHRYFIWSTEIEHSLGSAAAQLARIGAEIALG
jgi:alkylation response protein AidB-like acyl-CoA dehydrogenase